ncbi:MAG: hypothetical protein ACYCY6_00895 [Minisyncoccota bacterium]
MINKDDSNQLLLGVQMYIKFTKKALLLLGILSCTAIFSLYASSMVKAGWDSPDEKLKGVLIIFGFAVYTLTLCFMGFTLKKLFPVDNPSPVKEIKATRF